MLSSIALTVFIAACREPYDPPVVRQDANYLVVDAFLNAQGPTTARLSRTLPLYSKSGPPPESGAVVTVESAFGLQYNLAEKRPGFYEISSIPVDPSMQYRLHIRTGDGMEYYSEFVDVKITPPIDSVFWRAEPDGLQLYVDTHDPVNQTRYYKWDFVETFEYNAPYSSAYMLIDGNVYARPPSQSIYTCWRTDSATSISVGTTAKLADDIVSDFPLVYIEKKSLKISRKYSILVQQIALTEEGYDYWRQLEQTTEKLGGLFDPLPAQVTGNYYNFTNPAVPALGFFSAGTVEEERIYVRFHELPGHLRDLALNFCVQDSIANEDLKYYGNGTLLITSYGTPTILGYVTSTHACIDCRLQGGTTTKPDFWE